MERLQKKCFLVSASLHGLLLGVLVFGSGFLTDGKKTSLPVLEMIPAKFIVTDRMTTGGGNPNVTTPPAAQAMQPVPPAPAAPTTPPAAERATTPPPARENVAVPTPKAEKVYDFKPLPPKKTTDGGKSKTTEKKTIVLKPLTKTPSSKVGPAKSDPKNSKSVQADSDAINSEAIKQFRTGLGSLAGVVKNSFSPGTSVETAGPGGAAFINYSQLVQSKYQMGYSQLVRAQPDLARGDAEVEVDVVLGRDGRVISARIMKPSGNSALNKLVTRLIKEVIKEIAPFPADATDERRTFNLTFELKAKLAG